MDLSTVVDNAVVHLTRQETSGSNSQMAKYTQIRIIEFVDRIPQTISYTICKAALRQ